MVFKGFGGVTQEDLLYLTIFYVLMYLLVCHCVYIVTDLEEVPEVWGREVKIRDTFFYAGNGLISSTHLKWFRGP